MLKREREQSAKRERRESVQLRTGCSPEQSWASAGDEAAGAAAALQVKQGRRCKREMAGKKIEQKKNETGRWE